MTVAGSMEPSQVWKCGGLKDSRELFQVVWGRCGIGVEVCFVRRSLPRGNMPLKPCT